MQVIGTRRAIRLSLTIPWELKPLELKFSTQKCSYHQNETRTNTEKHRRKPKESNRKNT